jgi:hypothetical protein
VICEISDIAAVVSIVGVIITALALWFTVRSFKDQLQLSFFADYTKRYQEITLNFPESINEKDFSFEGLSPEVRDKTLRYMRAYFDLCSEEYFLWRKKHIDNETWLEWKTGIEFAFSKTAFVEAWKILKLDTIYYGAFVEFANSSILKSQNKQLQPTAEALAEKGVMHK